MLNLYRSSDAGAPVWAEDGPSGLISVLKGCLVTGYGTKPAAGWAVLFDAWQEQGFFSLTNGARSGALGLMRRLSYNEFFVANGMLSASEPINGVSSGVAFESWAARGNDRLHSIPFSKLANRQWMMLATASTAMLFVQTNAGVSLYQSHPVYAAPRNKSYMVSFFFGALHSARGLGRASMAVPGNFVAWSRADGYSGDFSGLLQTQSATLVPTEHSEGQRSRLDMLLPTGLLSGNDYLGAWPGCYGFLGANFLWHDGLEALLGTGQTLMTPCAVEGKDYLLTLLPDGLRPFLISLDGGDWL